MRTGVSPLWASLFGCLSILSHHRCCTTAATQLTAASLVKRQYDADTIHIAEDEEGHTREFFNFVTRPDIEAPRWNIKVYDKDALSPGYWFTAPYEIMQQAENETRPWVGPHIYDQDGELVWSGTPMFGGWTVADFHPSNVNGEVMLTGLSKTSKTNWAIDSAYDFYAKIKPGSGLSFQNPHDWNTVWNGTRALAMTNEPGNASIEESESVGFHEGHCGVSYPGFEEYDTKTWKQTFKWSSKHHIHLKDVHVGPACEAYWDYLHANSIDKFADGDFLYSGRYTDSLYKISERDGSIVWTFSGQNDNSDFEFDNHFSGQHHARIQEENKTHIVLSLMDNAIRPGRPHTTFDYSRGLLILLDITAQPMKAHMMQGFDHPRKDYAKGRGSVQVLENGNVFAAWWWRSLLSEYSPDGKLLMEAETLPELKDYRSYKYPWIGRPSKPPDVIARSDGITTEVFMSWNGATEVHQWNVFETDPHGRSKTLLASALRRGFETYVAFDSVAQHVTVEAVDRKGQHLGKSDVFETIVAGHASAQDGNPQFIEENDDGHALNGLFNIFGDPLATFFFGIATCATVVLVFWCLWTQRKFRLEFNWRRIPHTQQEYLYERVFEEGEGEETETTQSAVDNCDIKIETLTRDSNEES